MLTKMPSASSPSFVWSLNDGTLGLLAAAIVLVSAVIWTSNDTSAEKTDFSLTYVGALIVHQGNGSQLYDLDLQKRMRDSIFAHPVPILFEHPPFEAFLLSPLAALPFRTAFRIWGLINAAVWLLLIVLLRRYLPWPRELLGYTFLWLLFAPLAVALYQGQSSIILVALFAITFLHLKNGRTFSAGVALGFGLIKLQFALPFALIFLLRRQWRFLAGFLFSAAVLTVLSIAAMGPMAILKYPKFLLTVVANPQDVSYGSVVDMPTVHGFLFALLGHGIDRTALSIISAFLSFLLLGLVALGWRSTPSDSATDLSFAAAICASLVTSSHIYTHDFSPLILSMFLAAAHVGTQSMRLRIGLVLSLAMFWSGVVYFVCVAWHCMYLMCPVLLLFLLASLQGAKCAARRVQEKACVTA